MTLLAPKTFFSKHRIPSTGPLREASLPFPVIEREGVLWTGGVGDEPLRVRLELENPSAILPTLPGTALLGVAPFGAFLRWKPLTRVSIPSLPPGGRRFVTLTAGGEGNRNLLPSLPTRAFSQDFGAWLLGRAGLAAFRHFKTLNYPHFVGNLNVFVTRNAPVERHVQRAIGLRPGHDNLALFIVGDGKRDSYTFSVKDQEPGWQIELAGIAWERPVELSSSTILLRVSPPVKAETGRISILVSRESTRQRVPVEFELEAGVSGSKCYFF